MFDTADGYAHHDSRMVLRQVDDRICYGAGGTVYCRTGMDETGAAAQPVTAVIILVLLYYSSLRMQLLKTVEQLMYPTIVHGNCCYGNVKIRYRLWRVSLPSHS